MKEMLKDDYDKFVASFASPMYKSLRVNNLKGTEEIIRNEIEIGERTPFDENTYYINDDAKLGKHPYHLGGLYYLQEPSATMAVNALDVQLGDKVLDMCAAPGGKSTQILSRLNNTGFLLSNEYEHKRAMTLLSNIERWGKDNYMLTNNSADKVAWAFEGYFDRVLVDAPCSGSSMFKKYPATINDYTEANVLACNKRQLQILDEAYKTLKQDGVLVYSTCTYNKIEDEEVVEQFLQKYPDMELVDTGLSCGVKGYDPNGLTRRVFPFNGGEGHFAAKFVKHGYQESRKVKYLKFSNDKTVEQSIAENCTERFNYTILNNKVYVSKDNLIDTSLNIIRSGVLMGEIVKGRIEPAHHFFVAYNQFKKICNITDPEMMNKFLTGLSLPIDGYKGYVQIRYNDIPVGFGKGDGSQIKNHFPKGLRIV